MKIDVSIIVPVYNAEKYLSVCIESLLKQNEVSTEIILVDDGSTDGSSHICLDLHRKYNNILYIRQLNSGPGKARENGIKSATGEYLFFCDADDFVEPEAVSQLFFCAKKSNADIVLGNIAYHDNMNEASEYSVSKIRVTPDKLYNISDKKELIYMQRLFLWGKLYKRSAFIGSGVILPPHFYEDTYSVPCIASKLKTMYYVDTTVYHYFRNTPGNTVGNLSRLQDLCLSLEEMVTFFKSNNIFEEYKNQLRYLILSQLRFVYRKFSKQDENTAELKKDYIQKITALLNRNFDYWLNTANIKIAVIKSSELAKAADCFALTSDAITLYTTREIQKVNPGNTDLIITYDLYDELAAKSIPTLVIGRKCKENKYIRCIPEEDYMSDDAERRRWDMADAIMNRLNESWDL